MSGMELHATPSRIARSLCRRARTVDYSLFEELASRYAQEMTDPGTGQALDPTQLQQGQPVYDQEGDEWLVVGNPDDTTSKVVMPADQQGAQVPENVTTVEDAELASTYSLQPPTTARKADIQMDMDPGEFRVLSPLEGPMRLSEETAGLRIGQEGYVDVITAIQDMKDCGYETVDIVLNIGEMYPRELGERVLAEARRKGIL